MADYDYGNARIRAMKSRLLSRRELDGLSNSGSLQGLIAALTKTTYSRAVEVALTRSSGIYCITEALRDDLITSVGKINQFYDGQAGEFVTIVLRRYDIHNLKAILRGLGQHDLPGDIMVAMLPVGELKIGVLTELTRSPDVRAAIDLMASMATPFARPILDLRAEQPGAGTVEMELALERWLYREAYQTLMSTRSAGKVLLSALQLEADLTNLMIALRFVRAPGERKFLSEWLHLEKYEQLFVEPGRLSYALLHRVISQDMMDAAIEILADTPYESPLRLGLKAYANSALLSEFEKQLNRFRLSWMVRQITRDPLGIGVVLGYLALKINEVNNLRWIAQGIQLGLKESAIQAELEYSA